jgi:hypothetical protein
MLKYALRYTPLLVLVLLLVPLRFYLAGNILPPGQYPANPRGNKLLSSDHSQELYGIAGLPDGEVWAVGGIVTLEPATRGNNGSFKVPSGGTILHFIDNSWAVEHVRGPLNQPLLSISLDSAQDGWAVGLAGTLVHYDGTRWSIRPGPTHLTQNLLSIKMLSAQNGWAVGSSGTILHYDGKQWIDMQSPTTLDLHSIAFTSPKEGWAVGNSGTILHYHDGRWDLLHPVPTSQTLNAITMLSADEGWIVGNQGTILHDRNGSWESVHPAGYYQNPAGYQAGDFSMVAMSSLRSGWIAGAQHLLTYRSEAWIEAPPIGDPLGISSDTKLSNISITAMFLAPDGASWAVGNVALDDEKNTPGLGVILTYQAGSLRISKITGL